MNVRNDLQPAKILGPDIHVSSTRKIPRSSEAASSPIDGDQAHLSSAASLASQLASIPDMRAEKIQAVQMSIANGYSISSMDVARSVMNFMIGRGE